MRKLSCFLTVLLVMLLIPIVGQGQVSIKIKSGWTWFPYFNTEPMEISYALSPINPAIGDVVKSQEGEFSSFTSEGWTGSLKFFEPGGAYHYYSCKDDQIIYVYPEWASPIVETVSVTDISYLTAVGGGSVISSGGKVILARGVCWSSTENPTLADSHSTDGDGIGTFASNMTGLYPGVTYYVKAYVTTDAGTVYGDQKSFTTLTGTNVSQGFVSGYFTINDRGDKVLFSQGNLQYQASTNTWRFAEHQWDYVGSQVVPEGAGMPIGTVEGSSNHLASATYDGWIDLFAWGTSGINHGAICYQPWSTDMDATKYYAYGSESKNLFDEDGTADWGYNAISNGGNQPGQWRTLTGGDNGEWAYLLAGRNTASGIRYAKAQIDSINGLIIVPDDWNSCIYPLASVNNSFVNCTDNIIDLETWETVFEANGCVFLPLGGYREEAGIGVMEVAGLYWSSSVREAEEEEEEDGASMVAVICELLGPAVADFPRTTGASVRLVSPVMAPIADLMVVTKSVTSVTENSAVGGGEVIAGGSDVTERGICWSTSNTPTTSDQHVASGSGMGEFTCEINGLQSNTTYYVRAYASDGDTTVYGKTQGFTTTNVETDAPEGAVNGLVTINAQGDQVFFSKGNLQYQASTNTWRFAEHQYDVVRKANGNISSTYDGWIDLFGWGTSGHNHGATCYQPWSISQSEADYYAYGSVEYNLNDQDGTADWGCNAISNGGNVERRWRSMTGGVDGEWDYVLNKRQTASGIRYMMATVNGVFGAIVVPDDWNTATYPLNGANIANPDFPPVIDAETWTNVLENHGCAFLPADAYRYGNNTSNIQDDEDELYYWTATSGVCAVRKFYGSKFKPDEDYYKRYNGMSVRLVMDHIDTLSLVMVNRGTISDITENSAVYDGEVVNNSPIEVTSFGVCWSTGDNPTVSDNHYEVNGALGSFTYTLTGLTSATSYNIRAYAVTPMGTVYGEQITFNTPGEPAGIVQEGVFTINSNGEQVYFSKGNLQYQASTNTWRFAEHQWDYVGNSDPNLGTVNGMVEGSSNFLASSTYDGWIDLFSWGTSGYNHGAVCYQPWSRSASDADFYAYGAAGNNLYDQDGKADWGYNAISNGGNEENQWRTLTGGPAGEWYYLTYLRPTASGIRFARAQVNDINGIILVPDNWDTRTFEFNDTNEIFGRFDYNVISASTWENVLEPNGCVFLPAAGGSEGETIGDDFGEAGLYWSSSCGDTLNSNVFVFVKFLSGVIGPYIYDWYTHGTGSVRLVHSIPQAIITSPIHDVTSNSAICDVEITEANGSDVTARGVCWSTSPFPTIEGNHSSDGTGPGTFSRTITDLTYGTVYYVRAYATYRGETTIYGAQQSFTTLNIMTDEPEGAASGKFSINAQGDQIVFAQGNLQYQASTNTWRFAEHQWDCVGSQVVSGGEPGGTVAGSSNHLISSTYEGWIDLFGWGTSGFNHGAVCYQPWSTSSNDADYYAYGSSSANLFDNDGSADWGHNAISNAGNEPNQWRTLTGGLNGEWDYILNRRETESGIRFALGEINDILGVILVPDDWQIATYPLNYVNQIWVDEIQETAAANELTLSDWDYLEQHGCVFLPAAGAREGEDFYALNAALNYWTANADIAVEAAGREGFRADRTYAERSYGYSVRLASDYVSPLNSIHFGLGSISEITYNTARYDGEITYDGDLEFVSQGMCWSTRPNPTVNDSISHDGMGTGEFFGIVTGLNHGTTYYLRPYVTTLIGTTYGPELTFATRGDTEGVVKGMFTVNSNGNRVYFSQGNLQYQASTNTWRFAEHQWDYVGNALMNAPASGTVPGSSNHLASPTYSGWIDMFGWATSGYDHGSVCYQPWSQSLNNADYYAYGKPGSPLYAKTGKADWGYNAISNGGNQEGLWRTLTGGEDGEWSYLLYLRPTTTGTRFAKAKVNNVNGIVLVPDDWDNSAYTFNEPNDNAAGFQTNVIDAAAWTNDLEANGCIFLPAAGTRYDGSDGGYNEVGLYWGSSCSDTLSPSVVLFMKFLEGVLGPAPFNVYESYGASVRVVHTAPKTITIGTPIDVTSSSASFSAEISSECGTDVTARGICWSTSQNPVVTGSHTSDGTGSGEFTSSISDLTASTTYYVRAYASYGDTTYYSIQRSFVTLSDEPAEAPTGGTLGRFTINGDGNQVVFSQGNLQYQASTNTWRFAEHQWDFVGNSDSSEEQNIGGTVPGSSNHLISSTYDGWIDLFGWATSGYNHGGEYYQPWSIASGYYTAYGISGANLYDQDGTADWGYNAISNGGNEENQWRTLTGNEGGEWDYIFNLRETSSGIRFAMAIVNGVYGVVVVPDDWDSNIYTLFEVNNSESTVPNVIDAATWTNYLEAHGCVFMPAAGVRYSYGNSPSGVGEEFYYWTSSATKYIQTYPGGLIRADRSYYGGGSGMAVRLAQDYVEPAPEYGTPSVTTDGVSDITCVSAVCAGTVVSSGGYEILTRGVCWGTQENPSMSDHMETVDGGVGSFTCSITGLQQGTTYYVRAFVLLQSGFTFGEQYSFTTKEAPAGSATGMFTVNSNGEQVFFSQGNLQYQAATNTWRFAEHQWDYVGNASTEIGDHVEGTVPGSSNHLIASDYDGWIDLFCWGTSNYNHGAILYQPWSIEDFIDNYWPYGIEGANLYDGNGQADWGYNAISNGGNEENQWRSMRGEEWSYLFNTRSTSSGIRFAAAVVNGTFGIILVPDDWNSSVYSLNHVNDPSVSSYICNNVIDAQTWTTVLEPAGCVFLPSAGYRLYTAVHESNQSGYYWSSSSRMGMYYCVSGVTFSDIGSLVVDMYLDQWKGYSVRLVRPASIAAPTVMTGAVTDITMTTATMTGKVLYNGGSPVTEKGVCYSTSPEPTLEDGVQQDSNEGDTIVWNIGFLSPNTTYYVRAYAINAIGTSYGNEVTFTTADMPEGPTGASPGTFTINENGDKVYFAQGNLQYQASTNTWKFADDQYDIIGEDNCNISENYTGWIDLFCWGTSGIYHGATCYQPWSISLLPEDYYAYGSSNKNLYDENGSADWGYNAISNGGDATQVWRTLTSDEWDYLLNQRFGMSGMNYAKAQVNGINGLILIPDDWLYFGVGFNINDSNNIDASFTSNVIDAAAWDATYGRFGCVFLPIAGIRGQDSAGSFGTYGGYWSSSYYNDNEAKCIYTINGQVNLDTHIQRSAGIAVRLVRSAD